MPHSIFSHLCLFHRWTGLDCPLCGLTRAMLALAQGHWQAALRYNALTPMALAMLATFGWNHPWRGRIWTAGIAAFAVYGVCRAAVELAAR